jgi:hypothetical protein
MKFVGLFGKTPAHKRFNFIPRHYDPAEEERKEREERIKQEIEAGLRKEETEEELALHRSKIKGAIQSARKRSNMKAGQPSAAILRTAITLFLVIQLWAYLQFGSVALYGMLLLVPVYLFMKLRSFSSKK